MEVVLGIGDIGCAVVDNFKNQDEFEAMCAELIQIGHITENAPGNIVFQLQKAAQGRYFNQQNPQSLDESNSVETYIAGIGAYSSHNVVKT